MLERKDYKETATLVALEIVTEIKEHHANFTKSRSIANGPLLLSITGGMDCLERPLLELNVSHKIETKDSAEGTNSTFLVSLEGKEMAPMQEFSAALVDVIRKENYTYETRHVGSNYCIEGNAFYAWESPVTTITLD